MKSLPTRPVWPISGAPRFLSYSFGESPTPNFMSPSPSTCDRRPGMLQFMSLKRGIGHRSTSLLMSLGLCLRAGDCENAWQVGLACPSARETPKAGKFSGPARARKISLRAFSFSGQTELPSCPSIARIKLSHSGRLLIQPRAAVSDARTLRARVRIASGGFLFTNRLSAVAL